LLRILVGTETQTLLQRFRLFPGKGVLFDQVIFFYKLAQAGLDVYFSTDRIP
jgi:hypothetical protein